jgi:uncharacterized protein involved in type VI secretion and phage assembly
MGQSKKITHADLETFRLHLLTYLDMAEKTRQASIAAAEAEQAKQRVYAAESSQREVVVALWEKLRNHEWLTYQHFKLPDGRIVKVERGLIHVVDTVQI